ncbi:hypothetical protein AVEN_13576-1 [Araneus ventricosus]|uniref:Uncharacterized protein n=1 Tax=Araneus ventricosus TaxID=182803 RepID=A0A4Y2D5H2_ARAVE|nr:hypothetical protein AVEN_13576-1 [Araneus ventricosus]
MLVLGLQKDYFALGLRNASSLIFVVPLLGEKSQSSFTIAAKSLLPSLRSYTSAAIDISSWLDVSRMCLILRLFVLVLQLSKSFKSFCGVPALLLNPACEIVSILAVAISGNDIHSSNHKEFVFRKSSLCVTILLTKKKSELHIHTSLAHCTR